MAALNEIILKREKLIRVNLRRVKRPSGMIRFTLFVWKAFECGLKLISVFTDGNSIYSELKR
jgi:hypothetical protein